MKVHEVPQDDVPDYSEGITKGKCALDGDGKYVRPAVRKLKT